MAGDEESNRAMVEVGWEMKAISVLFTLLAMPVSLFAAKPVNPAAVTAPASTHGLEPVWMVLSGAALLAVASAVRRYVR
jgi:hypothetical protein